MTFAPVANFSASYFSVSETTVNYFSLVFFIAFIPFCVFSWWVIETYGFRFAVSNFALFFFVFELNYKDQILFLLNWLEYVLDF